MFSKNIVTGLFLASLLSGLIGCGSDIPPLGKVEGVVTYNGKALKNGNVIFQPVGNLPSAVGIIDANGKYIMKTRINDVDREGAPIGEHRVMIVSIQEVRNRLPEDRSPLPPPNIPTKYNDVSESVLTAKVEGKLNTINFDLK